MVVLTFPSLAVSPTHLCPEMHKVLQVGQVGREEALGLFLETGSAFCPEVEIMVLSAV